MRHALLVALALLACSPGIASAGGINIAWGDCGMAGSVLQAFSCDRNTGVDLLVGSFEPFQDFPQVSVIEADIDVFFRGPVVPAWWQVQPAGPCPVNRFSVLGVSSVPPPACPDPWQGQINGTAVTITPSVQGDARRARITVTRWVSLESAATVSAGTEYLAYILALGRARSTGSDACWGCEEPALLTAMTIRLMGPLGDILLNSPLDRWYVCWQCACYVSSHGEIGFGPPCPATPISAPTWGAIKGFYR